MRPTCGVWHRMVPSLAVWYPALVKLRGLVPENLHVRISDLVFLRSRGTKLRFLAEFGVPNFRSWKRAGAISRILSEKDGYRFIRAVGLWLWSPCRRRQMDRRGRRAALPGARVRCGSALCGAMGDRRARPRPRRERGAAAKAEGSRLGLPSAPPLPQSRRRRPQPDLRKCQRVTTPLAKSRPGLRCCMQQTL